MPGATARSRELGSTGVEVSAIGIGTNKWSKGKNDDSVFETYRTLLDAGISFIDTAEVYGFGKSERLIGDCLKRDGRPVFIASKFANLPGRSSPRHLHRALDGTLARLGLESLDLYFIHLPFFGNHDALADAMVDAVHAGKVRHVGVSNFGAEQMCRFANRLARENIPLAANEVSYSLFNRKPETNGVLKACSETGASLVAYFPLAHGRLAGPPAGKRTEVQALIAKIALAHGASASQVALNWLRARDPCVIPIPGASRAQNARQNARALDWSLTADEFDALDKAAPAP